MFDAQENPGGQTVQLGAWAAEYVPAEHKLHDVEFPGENVPAVQFETTVEVHDEPGGHAVHAVAWAAE